MKKILVFRSVTATHMKFIIKNTINHFGDHDITVFTRPESSMSMKTINGVKSVITCSQKLINSKNLSKNEKDELRKYCDIYDMAIIPISGNIHSYNNILKFSKEIFKIKINFYHLWEGNYEEESKSIFIDSENKNYFFRNIFSRLFPVFLLPVSFIFSIIILLVIIPLKIVFEISRLSNN